MPVDMNWAWSRADSKVWNQRGPTMSWAVLNRSMARILNKIMITMLYSVEQWSLPAMRPHLEYCHSIEHPVYRRLTRASSADGYQEDQAVKKGWCLDLLSLEKASRHKALYWLPVPAVTSLRRCSKPFTEQWCELGETSKSWTEKGSATSIEKLCHVEDRQARKQVAQRCYAVSLFRAFQESHQ